ncbi:hypothetical protein J6590_039550 [Homalodisca vitripennis]|nr:hypothetical protein J6590_039550 [Homalodisca vitripennis]
MIFTDNICKSWKDVVLGRGGRHLQEELFAHRRIIFSAGGLVAIHCTRIDRLTATLCRVGRSGIGISPGFHIESRRVVD